MFRRLASYTRQMALGGISGSGADAEAQFLLLTGASPTTQAALGDAILDGHYVEVKKASSPTLNQVRAVKYITLVAYAARADRWYVVPASDVVRLCAQKTRGQHTENPFESATLNLNHLETFAVSDPAELAERVRAAISMAAEYPELKHLMESVLDESKDLAVRSIEQVRMQLKAYGLA